MRQYHHEKGGVGTLHLIRVEDPSPFGCVVHDNNGRVKSFVEKPAKGQEPTNEINAGTYLLAPVVHSAELEQLELVPVAPAAPLPKQGRPWRTQPDGNSNARHQRQGH